MNMVKKDYKQIKHIKIFQVENRPYEVEVELNNEKF